MIPEHLDYGVYYPDYYDWEHAENSDEWFPEFVETKPQRTTIFVDKNRTVFIEDDIAWMKTDFPDEPTRNSCDEDTLNKYRLTATEILRDWTGGEP